MAEFGKLTPGLHRTVGTSINPYHQFQFAIKSSQDGAIDIDNVDFEIDLDDPYLGDPSLFP